MTSQLELDRRRLLAGLGLGLGSVAIAACGRRAGAQVAAACAVTPTVLRGWKAVPRAFRWSWS